MLSIERRSGVAFLPQNEAKPSRRAPIALRKRSLVPCPKCPSLVRQDRLTRHLIDKHGVTRGADTIKKPIQRTSVGHRSSPRRLSGKSSVGAASVQPRSPTFLAAEKYSGTGEEDDDDENGRDDYGEERRLDGSSDYWEIREDGRFGSYPSYDDCDDESAP